MKTTTQTDLRRNFWDMLRELHPELAAQRRTRRRQNEYPADIRTAWVDFTNAEHRAGNISDALAGRAVL